jgi:uncharacterized protein (DUF427 family)
MEKDQPAVEQESAWDYPRPPVVEPADSHFVVELDGRVIAETRRGYRVLETSHPPTIYFPPADVERELLVTNSHHSFCEFKGRASYLDARTRAGRVVDVGWFYPAPAPAYVILKGHIAFYPSRVDACYIDGERAEAQSGDFYGGWITSRVTGPFKGGTGTGGW